jgi:hypothetical protein
MVFTLSPFGQVSGTGEDVFSCISNFPNRSGYSRPERRPIWHVDIHHRQRHSLGRRWLRDRSRSRLGCVMALTTSYTYNVSSNGPAGDWYWELIRHNQIIARGLAATEPLARADAMKAARSHESQPQALPAYPETPLPRLPAFDAA